MTAAVEVQGVGRVFTRRGGPPVAALTDVSLTVPAGSRFGIVGESGSGKTTLVNLIAALDRPTSGRVLVDGVDVGAAAEKRLGWLRRRLQVVFQDPFSSLDPRRRIGEIVAEPLQVQKVSRPEQRDRVARALLDVGLDPAMVRRYPHQFSGGQRQRISIARAIVGDPGILIADEAVSALDVTVRATVLELVERLARERSLTLLFVSHDLAVIRRVCDQVAVLRAGRLVELGPTAQVYSAPRQDYTKALLAAVPTLARSLRQARERADDGPHGSGEEDRPR